MLVVHKHNPITMDDVQLLLAEQKGTFIFADVLAQIKDSSALLRILAQFVEFNSIFGAGVVNLAAQLALRKDLFKDNDENIPAFADKSSDIAACIYFAAIDEFNKTKTHRKMSIETLRTTAKALGFDDQKISELTKTASATTSSIEKVRQGYCLSDKLNISALLQGLGFHIGSESLAVEEFEILHAYLQAKQTDLVKALESAKVYTWVIAHPILEQQHFEAAVEAANLALQYSGKADAKSLILKGLSNFIEVQTEFMISLLQLV